MRGWHNISECHDQGERAKTMRDGHESKTCPFLGEMWMQYCQAYPVRKPIPKQEITTPSPCTGREHEYCPLFNEFMARMHFVVGKQQSTRARRRPGNRKEVN